MKTKEELKEYKRQYYLDNIDRIKVSLKVYREKNKEYLTKKEKNYKKTPKGRYVYAKAQAKRKNTVWEIPENVYIELIKEKCHYCGNIIKTSGISLDRIDNIKGYLEDNVVSCCKDCNTLKRDFISYTEMLEVIEVLKKSRGENIWNY